MNEIQVHQVSLNAEQALNKIDQDGSHDLTKPELATYIAKHPTDVDTVTAAKFMMDNFQLISNLDPSKDNTSDQSQPASINAKDLHVLDLLTNSDGKGVSQLAAEDTKSAMKFGALAGVASTVTWTFGADVAGVLPEVMIAAPPVALIAGTVIVGAAVGAGIAYGIDRYTADKTYDEKQTEVNTLFSKPSPG
jgi:hypothetical protein